MEWALHGSGFGGLVIGEGFVSSRSGDILFIMFLCHCGVANRKSRRTMFINHNCYFIILLYEYVSLDKARLDIPLSTPNPTTSSPNNLISTHTIKLNELWIL